MNINDIIEMYEINSKMIKKVNFSDDSNQEKIS